MNNHELFNRAKWWLGQGVDVVPIQSQSKALVKGYGARSKHVTSEKEAWLWFAKLQVNLGVVCGGLMGLVCMDFDAAPVYEQWRAGPGQELNTLTEKTGRGFHVFFTSPHLKSVLTKEVELRASEVIMVAPSVHPNGQRYEIVVNAPIAQLTLEQVTAYFPFTSELLLLPEPPNPFPEVLSVKPDIPKGERVTDRIKAAYPVSEEARKLTDLQGREGHYYGRCPFHPDNTRSFSVNDEKGIWRCFSTNCPTNVGNYKAHDVINLREWAAGISTREAISELAREVLPPLQSTGESHNR